MNAIAEEIAAVFAEAGAQGFLHAREIGVTDGPEVAVGADAPVVLASVFKIPVAVAYVREVAAGRLDETERTRVTARYRVGGIGTAGCVDDVEMSWRDLALFMLTMSDNAATDVVFHRVGQDAVDRVLTDLGLSRTRIRGCCEDLFASLLSDLGAGEGDDAEAVLAAAAPEQLWKLAVLDPARTTSSTRGRSPGCSTRSGPTARPIPGPARRSARSWDGRSGRTGSRPASTPGSRWRPRRARFPRSATKQVC